MEEIWKKVSVNNNYSVSNCGRVRNDRNGHIMHPRVRSITAPYLGVTLSNNGKGTQYNVHRLVAIAFIGEPPKGYVANHKDGNKVNNNADNLEWVTPSENCIHAYNMGLRHSTSEQIQAAINATKRRVRNLTLGTVHESIAEAARVIGGQHSGISKCLSGERATYYGMRFAYEEG